MIKTLNKQQHDRSVFSILRSLKMNLSLKSRRKCWLKIHLYLGLFAGAIFVVIGLTGSILAFGQPLDEWLNHNLMMVTIPKPSSKQLPLDEIVLAGMKALPSNGRPESIGFPRHPGLAFELWFHQPSLNENVTTHQIFIDPYTAEVTGQRLLIDFQRIWRNPFKDFILRLHYTLALGLGGAKFVGFIGLGLLFSTLTGLILWWPNPGKIKNALTIKGNTSPERFNYDLHKTFGFYSSLILFFLIPSGVYLIFPEYGRTLVNVFSPVKDPYPIYRSGIPTTDKSKISLNKVKEIADARFPDGEYRFISIPENEQDVYFVGKPGSNDVNQKSPYRRLWIDQYNGKIIHVQDKTTRSAGDAFVEWVYPLHSGEAFGFIGQLIVSISGLVPLVLYVTGFTRWLQKRNAKKRMTHHLHDSNGSSKCHSISIR